MVHLALYLVLVLVMVAGLAINLFNLPGLWVMVAATVFYGWWTAWAYVGLKALTAMVVLALIAEVLEFTSSGKAAKQAGASRRGFWGAIAGGIVGGIVLTGIIPIPIVGTVFGILSGHLPRARWHLSSSEAPR